MITCKSPVKVMRAAHELGRQLFDERAHKFARKDFTLPQLFACLVLREHQRKSYRGVEALLADCSDLRAAVGLPRAPDHNTLWRAFDHLVKPSGVGRALDVQAARAAGRGLDVSGDTVKPAAMDSTCFESRHVSRHFDKRRRRVGRARRPRPPAPKNGVKPAGTAADRRRSRTAKRLPKLSLAVAASCHLILAARATTGLGSDHPHFGPLLAAAGRRAAVAVVVADAGYDSEANHALAWDGLGVAAVIPPLIGRPSDKPPDGLWRGVMRERFAAGRDAAAYGQRWQVETVNSMLKRNLGSACRATHRPPPVVRTAAPVHHSQHHGLRRYGALRQSRTGSLLRTNRASLNLPRRWTTRV